MDPFEHHMYVLECGDGSLYTGYATDVAARLAAHQAGRGARYTRSHPPVRLVAQARFYSKGRAMAAEARFKRLSRAEKDELLRCAGREPLEDVLRRALPGFGGDTAQEFVCRSLAGCVNPGFAAFQRKLVPTVDPRRIVGVRTPDLRRIARELVRRSDCEGFLSVLPHRLFEEMQVHALAIGAEGSGGDVLARYDAFLPHVDNWATCDQLPTEPLASCPVEALSAAERWIGSGSCYPMRFGIRVLMALFLGERFEPRLLDMVARAHLCEDGDVDAHEDDDVRASDARYHGCKEDAYYLNMARAWFFAEALAWQPVHVLPYLERPGAGGPLDEWTRRKAIQKAIESRKIPAETKAHLRGCR